MDENNGKEVKAVKEMSIDEVYDLLEEMNNHREIYHLITPEFFFDTTQKLLEEIERLGRGKLMLMQELLRIKLKGEE